MSISLVEITTFLMNAGTHQMCSYKLFYGSQELNVDKFKDGKGSVAHSNSIQLYGYIIVTNVYNCTDFKICFSLSNESNQNIVINNAKEMITNEFFNKIKSTPQFKASGINCSYEELITNNESLLEVMHYLAEIGKK